MKLESLFIGICLFIVVFAAGQQFLSDAISEYKIVDANKLAAVNSFNKMGDNYTDVLGSSSDMKTKMSGEPTTSDSAIDNMYSGTTKAIRTNPYTVAESGGVGIENFFKESPYKPPTYIIEFIVFSLITLTVISLLYLMFRVVR
jgi:hypothetical protein